MATTCKKNREKGFSLLEVLIAVSILAIGLLAMGTAETISVTNSYTGRNISVATAASEEIFERMRRNRANILSYHGFDTEGTRPATAGILQTDYDEWKSNIERVSGACATVSVTANTPVPAISTAIVITQWPPCDGTTRQVSIETLFE